MSMNNSNGKADAYKILTSRTGLITPPGLGNPVNNNAVLDGCGHHSHKVPIAASKPYGKRAEHTREALP